MADKRGKDQFDRRDFLKMGGTSAATLGAMGCVAASPLRAASGTGTHAADEGFSTPVPFAPLTKYPKLVMITRYSRQKLAFATKEGYEGVVLQLDNFFDPDKL